MAEPIEIPFCMKTRVGPVNHALDGGADPQGKRQFSGAVRVIQKHDNLGVAAAFTAKWIILSPIT